MQVAHLYVALVNFVLEVLNLAVPDHEDAVLDLKQVRLALDAPDVGGGTLLETLDGLALVLDDAVLSRMCTIITYATVPFPHTRSQRHTHPRHITFAWIRETVNLSVWKAVWAALCAVGATTTCVFGCISRFYDKFED